jgi:hypothetical protein
MSRAARPARRRATRGTQRPQPRRERRNYLAYVGQLASAATLVSTVVGLVFVFRPGCKPQDVAKATISDVRVHHVTFGNYLVKKELSKGSLSSALLRRPGLIVTFYSLITGLSGKHLPLRWELNDAATSATIQQDRAVSIVPSTNDEGRDWDVWVPVPRTKRLYYIVVTIYQPQKQPVLLQRFETREFRGVETA